MKWIERFTESIDHFAGEKVRKEVMEATGKLRSGSSSSRKAEWIKNAMEKVEALVDKETMKNIMMATCPHTFPKGRIQKLRSRYKKLGNIDPVTEKPYGWKKLVDEVVTLESRPIKWKIDGETRETKTWYFVEDEETTPEDLDVRVAGLIEGLDKGSAVRAVMMDKKASKDLKYKEALTLGQPTAGLELIDGKYQEPTVGQDE